MINGEYQYSIVSDPFKASLFVLARNVNDFETLYNDEVAAFLKNSGFTNFLNKPIKTYHGDDCNYTPLASSSSALASKVDVSDVSPSSSSQVSSSTSIITVIGASALVLSLVAIVIVVKRGHKSSVTVSNYSPLV